MKDPIVKEEMKYQKMMLRLKPSVSPESGPSSRIVVENLFQRYFYFLRQLVNYRRKNVIFHFFEYLVSLN